MISNYDAAERRKRIEECDHDGDVEIRDEIILCNNCSGFLGYDT